MRGLPRTQRRPRNSFCRRRRDPRPDRRRLRRRPRRPPPPDDESSAVPTEGERRPRRRPPPLRPLLRREPARVLGRRDGRHVVRTVRQVDAHALVVVRRRVVGIDGVDADAAVSPSSSLPDYVAVASPSRRRPRPTAAVAVPNDEGRHGDSGVGLDDEDDKNYFYKAQHPPGTIHGQTAANPSPCLCRSSLIRSSS